MKKKQYLVVAALIRNTNKVLLVYKHSSSADVCREKWELPGGKARFGLDFFSALAEKVKDYLGVDVQVKKIIPHVFSNVTNNGNTHFYVLVGECELLSNNIKLNTNKLSEYKWVSLIEAVQMNRDGLLVDGDLSFIKVALSNS